MNTRIMPQTSIFVPRLPKFRIIISQSYKKRILSLLTQQTRSQFRTLLDAITLTADDDTQDAIIYVSTDQPDIHVTRGAFRTAVATTAHALIQLGIQPGDLLIIAHTQSLESIYLFWGALAAGAVPSMFPTLTEKLDPAIYMQNMAELVRFSAVRAILTTNEFAPQLAEQVNCPVYASEQFTVNSEQFTVNSEQFTVNSEQLTVNSEQFTVNSEQLTVDDHSQFTIHYSQFIIPNEVALLQHSSGTTGLQKGVALSHTAVLNQIAAYSDALSLSPTDIIVSWLPLYHDMGLIAGFLLPLIQGVPLVLISPFDWVRRPALLLKAIDRHHGTLCWLPNFAYNHCARRIRKRDKEGLSLASMRSFINCSEPVLHDSHQLFLEKFAANGVTPQMLSVSYAMAENTFAVTQTAVGKPARVDVVDRETLALSGYAKVVGDGEETAVSKVSCGAPIEGTAVCVLDEAGHALPERQVGELAVQSNCMLTEYHQRPDLQPFTNGWFRTGDRGYMADGEVYVIGRSKDLIINAGKNVYPQDIEAIVNEVAGVHAGRAVVFGVPDEREGTELIAVVAETREEDPEARQELGKAIRQEVARQSMVTVSFAQLVDAKWLIKTSSGKIARAANREKWLKERKKQ
ncbi:MAG: AMP-binding protein [Aquificales bacterium]|nr:AMP-binding protein [Aquificales bacterium]